MSLTDTPNANRLHIALFGRRNSGKSSLINALTGQDTALVSDTPGTTTDPVAKAMEIHGIGPCLFIDTPGFDDEGELGRMRIERTWKAVEKTDMAILFCGGDTSAGLSKETKEPDFTEELYWLEQLLIKTGPQFGFQKNLISRNPRFPHSPANGFFVHIGIGRVNQAVSALKSGEDGCLRFIRGKQKGANACHGHFDSVVQSCVFHK